MPYAELMLPCCVFVACLLLVLIYRSSCMQAKIRHFGTHSWGSELFEKQKADLSLDPWWYLQLSSNKCWYPQVLCHLSSNLCLSWWYPQPFSGKHQTMDHSLTDQELAADAWPSQGLGTPILTHTYRRQDKLSPGSGWWRPIIKCLLVIVVGYCWVYCWML